MPISVRERYDNPLPVKPFWIAGGILPRGAIMFMGAEAKSMKTWLGMDIAHNLATAGSFWGMEFGIPEAVGVHYFEQEIGEEEFDRRMKVRYDTLGIMPPEHFYYSSVLQDFFLNTTKGQMVLAKELEQSKAKVAFIDPIGMAFNGNENDSQDVAKVFTNLRELIKSFPELSFVVTHHFSKPPRDPETSGIDVLSPYNMRGSSRWFDNPDTLITIVKMADHPGEWKRLKTRFTIRRGPPVEGDRKISILPGGIVIPTQEQKAQVMPSRRALKAVPEVKWGGRR